MCQFLSAQRVAQCYAIYANHCRILCIKLQGKKQDGKKNEKAVFEHSLKIVYVAKVNFRTFEINIVAKLSAQRVVNSKHANLGF